jgi:hypothetical protein
MASGGVYSCLEKPMSRGRIIVLVVGITLIALLVMRRMQMSREQHARMEEDRAEQHARQQSAQPWLQLETRLRQIVDVKKADPPYGRFGKVVVFIPRFNARNTPNRDYDHRLIEYDAALRRDIHPLEKEYGYELTSPDQADIAILLDATKGKAETCLASRGSYDVFQWDFTATVVDVRREKILGRFAFRDPPGLHCTQADPTLFVNELIRRTPFLTKPIL